MREIWERYKADIRKISERFLTMNLTKVHRNLPTQIKKRAKMAQNLLIKNKELRSKNKFLMSVKKRVNY